MILLLMLCVGLIGANSLVLSPIASLIAQDLGAHSAAAVMTAAAIYGGGVALSALLLAPQADKIGAHKALNRAMVLLLLGLGLSSAAPSMWALSLGQGIAGVAVGIALPSLYSLAAMIAPKGQEARTIGLVLTGWTLSMVGGVTLSAYVADLWGWRTVFALLSLGIFGILITLRQAQFPPQTLSPKPTSPLSALRVPGIGPALFSVLVLGTGFYGIYSYLGAHLTRDLGHAVSDAGWLTLSYGLGFGAATLLDPWLDKVGPRRGLLVIFTCLVGYYAGMATLSHSYQAIILSMFGWGVLQHLGLNLTVGRLSALDPSQRGAVMGLNSTVMYLSVFGATMLFRPLFETGGIALCMKAAALLAVFGAVEALVARIRARQPATL